MSSQLFDNIEKEYKRHMQEIGGSIISSDSPGLDIKEKRMAYCITQDEMGRIMNLRRETISRIENGVINPTFDFVKKFSGTLALTRIIRELNTKDNMPFINSERAQDFSTSFLKLFLGSSGQNIELISEISCRNYQNPRNRVIKKLKH